MISKVVRQPKCYIETALAVPMVRRLRKPIKRIGEYHNLLRRMSALPGDLIAASDAGATKDGATSVGIAIGSATEPLNKRRIYQENRSVGSIDTTPFIGELEGASRVLRAAMEAHKQIHLIVDNRSVVGIFNRVKNNTLRLPKYCWAQIIESEEAIIANNQPTIWCPSHKKRKGWKPEGTVWPPGMLRYYNDLADKQATLGLETDRSNRQIDRHKNLIKINQDWVLEMYSRQRGGSLSYMNANNMNDELMWFSPEPNRFADLSRARPCRPRNP